MILFISDTHCAYHLINEQIEYAQEELAIPVSCVIHLGDFGIFRPQLYDFFIRKNGSFLKPVYFIEGNHEDFDAFDSLMKKYNNVYFTYLSRSVVTEIEGYKFLSLGGSAYMDAMTTPTASVIKDHHIDDCLEIHSEGVDIIITHDCPQGIGVPNSPGLEVYGQTGFARGDELARHFSPKLWIFGHHHKWFELEKGNTRYLGLSGSRRGFALLGENYECMIINHHIPFKKPSFLSKALTFLRILRPNGPSH
ncbi:metallophosphoesterase family protein [Desulforegula conservatrix]|uniref:metallophosphoesterase family protein n=1 Tax=Desulforegula conservatrix TaxID=153026 RepID=UPI0004008796|nr:metallophosphoesterase [Desulforegula conservatrix]